MCAQKRAVARAVRIAFVVGQLVMLPVRRHPEDRSALERHRAADGEEILERLRRLEPAVRVQAVIAEADAEADGHPVQHERDDEVGPREGPERRDGQDVEDDHEAGRDPVHGRESE